ncbi:MAG: N-acetylmuramoyl-L-alanine amidase [Akkermansia sp.]
MKHFLNHILQPIFHLLPILFVTILLSSCGKGEDRLYPYGGPDKSELKALGNPFANKTELRRYINQIYADSSDVEKYMRIDRHGFTFNDKTIPWQTPTDPNTRLWRRAKDIPPYNDPKKPLAGVRIGIDPGHIGGSWARMEQRENLIAGKYRIREGLSTQIVATLLAQQLKKLGAEVLIVRNQSAPVSKLTPNDIAQGLAKLRKVPVTPELEREAKLIFVRRVEINARAAALRQFNPDLTVCLHFDAGNTINPVDKLHLIVNGAFAKNELEDDELRWGLVAKLMGKVYPEEVALAATVAKSMAQTLQLPPLIYTPCETVREVKGQPYVWARNLLANCLYPGPVIYTEPFAMNNPVTARRMVSGDYDGTQVFDGKRYRSIYREYAQSVAEGIRNYFLQNRPQEEKSSATHQ